MKTPFFTAALLTALATATPVQAQSWNFSYTGFQYVYQDNPDFPPISEYRPDLNVSGTFTGQDSNHDGVISHDELTSLVVSGYDYKACEAGSNTWWHCGVEDNFRFQIDNRSLTMSAGENGHDPEGWVWGGSGFSTAQGYYNYRSMPGSSLSEAWKITPNTAHWVAAVPEANTWAMLMAGLGALGFIARRRRK